MKRILTLLVIIMASLNILSSQADTVSISNILRQAKSEVEALNFDRARILTQKLLNVLDGKDSFSISAKIKTLNMEATMAYHESDYEKAADLYNESLKISKANFPLYSYENAWAYYQMAWIHEQAFDMEGWTNYLDTTATLFGKVFPRDDCRHALIWQHRARMNYYNFGQPDSTLVFLNKAHNIYRECPGNTSRNLYDLYKIYYDVFLSTRQFDSADHYLTKQIEYIATQKGVLWDNQLAWKELSKAHLYRMDGNYEKAFMHFQYAESLFEKIPEQDTVPLITAKLYSALCVNGMGRHQEALGMFKKLFDFKEAYTDLTVDIEGLIYEGAAHAYASIGVCDSAVYFANKALSSFYNVLKKDNPKLLSLYITYGNCLSKLMKYKQADSVLQIALLSAEKTYKIDHPLTIRILIEQATAAIRHNDFKKAGQILYSIRNNRILKEFPELGYAHTIGAAELLKSETGMNLLNSDRRKEFISLIQKAILQFRDIRNQFVAEEARARSVTSAISGLHSFFPVLYEIYSKSPGDDVFDVMLQLSETHRSLILSEAVAQSEAYQLAGIPTRLQDEERRLKNELSGTRKKLDQEYSRSMPKQPYINNLLAEQIKLQDQFDKLIELFRDNYPAYYKAKFAHDIIQAKDVQHKLTSDEVIIEYMVVANEIYTFVLTDKEKYILKTSNGDLATANTLKIINLISQDNANENRREQLNTLGFGLYNLLVKPFEGMLKSNSSLIIIPDKTLYYLPFEILTTSPNSGKHRIEQFLIYQFPVQYQSSISMWMDQKRNGTDPVDYSLVISPYFESSKTSDASRKNLAQLNFAKKESAQIHQLLHGKLLSEKEASKSGFIRHASRSDLIHFATHAMADDRTGDYSWLAFSSSTPDSLLYIDEIYGLELNASLVVLSGCETGIGPFQNGEGLISLARAFTYAGAEAIVTSLWPVNDNATSLIMDQFYKHLKEGQPKDKALQLAKLDYLANINDPSLADPYYWAGFIAIGDMSSLHFSNHLRNIGFGIGLILLALVTAWFIYRKKIIPSH